MKKSKLSLLFILLLLGINSCDDKEDEQNILTIDYFPLEIGNYWQLDYSDRKEIIKTETIDNKTYFVLVYNKDTAFYRTENNKIIVKNSPHSEAVKFDLTANENDTWSYNSWTVKLVSKTDTIVIKDKKVINCYHFYFDIPMMADDEHGIWLAPGIGYIQEQCGECLHQIRKLDIAQIGGQIIDY